MLSKSLSTADPTHVAVADLRSGSDQYNSGFRRIVVLLVYLVTAPTVVLLVIGILMLVFYESRLNVLFGILVVTLVICLGTGSAIALVFLRREAKVSQLQSDFVSKVSHELRTPLTSIRLFVETLQREDLPAVRTEACLEALARETSRLTDRIERLLDWGRMEAGKRVYNLESDTVASLAQAASEAFDSVMLGEGSDVNLDIDPTLPTVRVDREAIVDALLNLMTNAHKYSDDSRAIRLSASADPKWVRISVADRGRGIPRSEQRRVFQKFYRIDERLSQAVDGSGLGLAIVSHIAHGHGGRVELRSEVGKGSIFTLLLPREPLESSRRISGPAAHVG